MKKNNNHSSFQTTEDSLKHLTSNTLNNTDSPLLYKQLTSICPYGNTLKWSPSVHSSSLPLIQVYLKVVSLVLHLGRHVPRQTTIRGTTPNPRRRPNNVRPSPFSPNSGLGPSSCPPSEKEKKKKEKKIQMAPVFLATHRIIHVLPLASHSKRHKTAPVPPTMNTLLYRSGGVVSTRVSRS